MAPLDQEALSRWIRRRLDEEKADAAADLKAIREGGKRRKDPERAGRLNALDAFLRRMKTGNLPELDDVEQTLEEFPDFEGGASPLQRGQVAAKQELRAKIADLMGNTA